MFTLKIKYIGHTKADSLLSAILFFSEEKIPDLHIHLIESKDIIYIAAFNQAFNQHQSYQKLPRVHQVAKSNDTKRSSCQPGF